MKALKRLMQRPAFSSSIMMSQAEASEPPSITEEPAPTSPEKKVGSYETPLPVELWREIFMLASSVPGKDEFSTESSTYDIVWNEESTRSTTISFEEQCQAIDTRLSIVHVCRYWYSVGIHILWSHLRINLRGKTVNFSTLLNIQEKLEASPELGASVLRFTALLPHGQNFAEQGALSGIIKHLPSLRIINSPELLGLSRYDCQPTVVVLEFPFSQSRAMTGAPLLPQESFWRNTRILDICGFGSHESLPKIHFPMVHTLRIDHQGGSLAGSLAEHLLTRCELPSLRVLSIHDWHSNNLPVEDFLLRYGSDLEQLELRNAQRPTQDIQLPKLRVISLSWTSFYYVYYIKAQQLNHLGFFQHPDMRFDIVDSVTESISIYPSVHALLLCIPRPYRYIWPLGREELERHVEGWQRSGIRVTITYC